MLLLGLDYETTGLDFKKDRITELGMVVYDTEAKRNVHFESHLVHLVTPETVYTEEARQVTGIEDADIKKFGVLPWEALSRLIDVAAQCDYLVAHNAEFEMRFTSAWIGQMHDAATKGLLEKPWIDTKVHVPYPANIGPRDLVSLCAHHKFFNPHPHRALWDTWAMMQILGCYDVHAVVKNSQEKKVKLWSKGITFGTRELPKSLSYYWDGDKKRWWTITKESEVDDAINKAKQKGFEVETEAVPFYTSIKGLEEVG